MTRQAPVGHAEYLATRVFAGLDGVRALSVTAVVWHHAGVAAWVPMLANGFLGVDVFFVLSGFLIVTLLLRERDRRGSISLRDFYARRTLRIFPLYYGLIGGLMLAHAVHPLEFTAPVMAHAPELLTYTANFFAVPGALAVTWSLAAEEQFYLVWPAIERTCGRLWWPVWLAALVVSQAFNFGLLPQLGLPVLEATFTPILLGVGLAHALHSPVGFAWFGRHLARPAARWIGLALLLGLVNIPGDIAGPVRLAFHVTVTATLGAVVLHNGTTGVLTAWPLRRIGVVSYGVYLLHMFVLAVVERATPGLPPALRFAAVLTATWLAAELSYRGFERRFLALKHRFVR